MDTTTIFTGCTPPPPPRERYLAPARSRAILGHPTSFVFNFFGRDRDHPNSQTIGAWHGAVRTASESYSESPHSSRNGGGGGQPTFISFGSLLVSSSRPVRPLRSSSRRPVQSGISPIPATGSTNDRQGEFEILHLS
jgi:hypothetical protein